MTGLAGGDCGVIEDLPTGWRGILHDLGRSLGVVQPTPGERAAEARQHFYCEGAQADNGKEMGGPEAGS
jgi:hypothetical protein